MFNYTLLQKIIQSFLLIYNWENLPEKEGSHSLFWLLHRFLLFEWVIYFINTEFSRQNGSIGAYFDYY
ncbi:hypothetical protein A0O21_00585 [Streptococcus pantholopis]|uniref:Uncharacterized protein n=1 Tax=Streptococcus pantholopis TaxID=1811193 RepID=A0A172Q5A0_9STRE|nr:hypothetical protein A0O21_00585 [Streptococcus pantholopis]